jgi:hypothetical protein
MQIILNQKRKKNSLKSSNLKLYKFNKLMVSKKKNLIILIYFDKIGLRLIRIMKKQS